MQEQPISELPNLIDKYIVPVLLAFVSAFVTWLATRAKTRSDIQAQLSDQASKWMKTADDGAEAMQLQRRHTQILEDYLFRCLRIIENDCKAETAQKLRAEVLEQLELNVFSKVNRSAEGKTTISRA